MCAHLGDGFPDHFHRLLAVPVAPHLTRQLIHLGPPREYHLQPALLLGPGEYITLATSCNPSKEALYVLGQVNHARRVIGFHVTQVRRVCTVLGQVNHAHHVIGWRLTQRT